VSDERIRDLERLAATGSIPHKTQWLVHRVRIGELSTDRLRLAAYLGDVAALAALTEEEVHSPRTHELKYMRRSNQPFRDWVSGLAEAWPNPKEIAVRACMVLVRYHLRTVGFVRGELEAPKETVLAVVSNAESWLSCPCWDHAEAVFLTGHELLLPYPSCLRFLKRAVAWDTPRAHEWTDPARAIRDSAAVCAKLGSPEGVRRVLETELLAWALGVPETR
jgi:hypothetical protein